MRSIFAICAFFVLLAFTNAETLQKARLRGLSPIERDLQSESAFVALKSTPFAKNLFAMMSLKFQSSGKLGAILQLLDELDTNIQSQQTAEDEEFARVSAQHEATIREQGRVIDEATGNLASWGDLLIEKTGRKGQLETEKKQQEAIQENIRAFLEQLAETRARESAAYTARVEDQNAMIAGLDEVIELFETEANANTNIDAATAKQVLDLLREIRASLSSSIVEDGQAESAAATKYAAFVAEQQAELETIATTLKSLTIEIATLTSEIESLKGAIEAERIKKSNAETLKRETETALETLKANHAANTQTRSEQRTLIAQVKRRLNENPENVQNFLNSVPS
jgi:chromosome segregation ATPase